MHVELCVYNTTGLDVVHSYVRRWPWAETCSAIEISMLVIVPRVAGGLPWGPSRVTIYT